MTGVQTCALPIYLTFYHLDVAVDPDKKFIKGKNEIRYKVLNSSQTDRKSVV